MMSSQYKKENNDFIKDIELDKPVYKNKIRHLYKLDYNYLVTTIIIIVIYIATINYISKTTKQVEIYINDISTRNKHFNDYVSNKNKETQILKMELDASKQFSYKLEEQLNKIKIINNLKIFKEKNQTMLYILSNYKKKK